MKTVSKKLFGMLLVLVLLVSAVPFQAFAENDCTVNADVVLNGSTIASVTVTTTANVGDILNVQEDAAVVSAIQSFYGSDADGFSVSSVTHNGSNVDGKAVSVNGNMNLKINITLTNPKAYTLTLDANGGKYGGADSVNITYHFGQALQSPTGTLTKPNGYNFAGWSESYHPWGETESTTFNFSQLYRYSGNKYLYAMWAEKTSDLTVNMVVDGVVSQVRKVTGVARSANVLNYIRTQDFGGNTIDGEVYTKIPQGYAWDGVYYANRECTTQIKQDTLVGYSCDVYVKFSPKKYTVSLNPNGGSVDPTSKEITYGKTLKLPIPTCKGKLFVGWRDDNGNVYTPGSDGKISLTYKIPDNSTYTAVWNDQARVLLRIYINGKTSSPDILLDVTNKTAGSEFTYIEARRLVRARYAPTSGDKVEVLGLFDETSWLGYVNKKDTSGAADTVIIPNTTETTEVYVMATNARIASSGSTSSGSSGSSGGIVDTTNPKSGDEANIEAAVMVMILAAAAAAVTTVVWMRKKKEI